MNKKSKEDSEHHAVCRFYKDKVVYIYFNVLSIILTFSMSIHISSCSFSVMDNTDCYF